MKFTLRTDEGEGRTCGQECDLASDTGLCWYVTSVRLVCTQGGRDSGVLVMIGAEFKILSDYPLFMSTAAPPSGEMCNYRPGGGGEGSNKREVGRLGISR